MRKKWEIEEEYRNFCRNNKELALQTLRELTMTPTETGKEDQRIAYCMEWMKQQGMESVHTDELGNVIWEYRPEQEKKVLYTAHLDTVFSLEEPLEIKEDGMIWRCPGITDDTVNVVMLLMAAKYVHETEPELPCGLIFAADLGEEGLGNLCGVRALVCHRICAVSDFGKNKGRSFFPEFRKKKCHCRACGSDRRALPFSDRCSISYNIQCRKDRGRNLRQYDCAGCLHAV